MIDNLDKSSSDSHADQHADRQEVLFIVQVKQRPAVDRNAVAELLTTRNDAPGANWIPQPLNHRWHMFQKILGLIAQLRPKPPRARETAHDHAFKSARREDCARMPRKNSQFEPKNATPRLDRRRPVPNGSAFREAHEIATIRLKSRPITDAVASAPACHTGALNAGNSTAFRI
jgi:hypothetical protein